MPQMLAGTAAQAPANRGVCFTLIIEEFAEKPRRIEREQSSIANENHHAILPSLEHQFC